MLEHTCDSVYLKIAIHWHGNRYCPTERIGVYRVHPVASLFPLIEGEEFDELVENIEGLRTEGPPRRCHARRSQPATGRRSVGANLAMFDGVWLDLVSGENSRRRPEAGMPTRVRQDEQGRLAGSSWQETGFVFTTSVGTPVDARSIIRHFHAILKRAGLPAIRFHDLRHRADSPVMPTSGTAPLSAAPAAS